MHIDVSVLTGLVYIVPFFMKIYILFFAHLKREYATFEKVVDS